ncbi:MAG: hypothetical protein IRY99_17255 [Isosphaeraceae bacterium]|nr:hypothetical protein [Isosphaeraceae bacterium]
MVIFFIHQKPVEQLDPIRREEQTEFAHAAVDIERDPVQLAGQRVRRLRDRRGGHVSPS